MLIKPQGLYAVVGQAEKYDEFKQEDLEEFQTQLNQEDKERQMQALEMRNAMNATTGKKDDMVEQQLRDMQSELLSLPKRKRVSLEMSAKHAYDSNVIRAVPRREKDDSLFDTDGSVLFDLS